MRLALLVLLAACGSSPVKAPAVTVPPRATTAGDPLLVYLPDGADAVAELDLKRLRENAVLARLVEAAGRREALGIDPLRDLDAVVAGVYRLGEDDAGTLFVLRGPGLAGKELPDCERVDATTFLSGPPALRERARGGLLGDARFRALRAAAMPARASGASVRVTARLTPRARVAAAGRLGLDEVPATVSLWLDVADDAALIALLGASDEKDAARLLGVLEGARAPSFLPSREGLRTEAQAATLRLIWVLTPRRYAAWIDDLRAKIARPSS